MKEEPGHVPYLQKIPVGQYPSPRTAISPYRLLGNRQNLELCRIGDNCPLQRMKVLLDSSNNILLTKEKGDARPSTGLTGQGDHTISYEATLGYQMFMVNNKPVDTFISFYKNILHELILENTLFLNRNPSDTGRAGTAIRTASAALTRINGLEGNLPAVHSNPQAYCSTFTNIVLNYNNAYAYGCSTAIGKASGGRGETGMSKLFTNAFSPGLASRGLDLHAVTKLDSITLKEYCDASDSPNSTLAGVALDSEYAAAAGDMSVVKARYQMMLVQNNGGSLPQSEDFTAILTAIHDFLEHECDRDFSSDVYIEWGKNISSWRTRLQEYLVFSYFPATDSNCLEMQLLRLCTEFSKMTQLNICVLSEERLRSPEFTHAVALLGEIGKLAGLGDVTEIIQSKLPGGNQPALSFGNQDDSDGCFYLSPEDKEARKWHIQHINDPVVISTADRGIPAIWADNLRPWESKKLVETEVETDKDYIPDMYKQTPAEQPNTQKALRKKFRHINPLTKLELRILNLRGDIFPLSYGDEDIDEDMEDF